VRAFRDRSDAGRQLAAAVVDAIGDDHVVVAGLPRGGVPVALEVARAIGAPLEVLVVRKIGAPSQPELAMGALGEDGIIEVDQDLVRSLRVSSTQFQEIVARERAELDRRVARYRGGRAEILFKDRSVVIVDDGIATGSSARAACAVARARGASSLVLATPVAGLDAARYFADVVDRFVALRLAEGAFAVGEWYQRFDQTTDTEVLECLERASAWSGSDQPGDDDANY
jgi:putative phosphoribosyl transferase